MLRSKTRITDFREKTAKLKRDTSAACIHMGGLTKRLGGYYRTDNEAKLKMAEGLGLITSD